MTVSTEATMAEKYIYSNYYCLMLRMFWNRIGGVIVSVIASRSGKSWIWVKPDYIISICRFPAKHATLRSKSRLIGSES